MEYYIEHYAEAITPTTDDLSVAEYWLDQLGFGEIVEFEA